MKSTPTVFSFRLLITFLLLVPAMCRALIVGGFDTDRAGDGSMTNGPYTEELRAAIVEAFPGSTFVNTDSLNTEFLAKVDLLLVGAPSVGFAVTLSPAEQANLLNFVKTGGGALIFSDNDSYAGASTDQANESFLDPFGVDSAGYIDSPASASSVANSHPVMNGRFGKVSALATYYAGWFDGLGSYALPLARYDSNSHAAALALAPDALQPGSGGVVFLADANALVDSGDGGYFGLLDNRSFVLNSVEFVTTPEPSCMAMTVCGFLLIASQSRRRS